MTKLTPTYQEIQANGGAGHPFTVVPAVPLNIPVPPPRRQKAKAEEPILPEPTPVAVPEPLKIALIGTAPSSRMLAPFADPSWKIWSCSPGNQGILPRVDVWFEIHGNLLWPEHKSYGEPYIEWLKKQPFPIYMQDSTLVPNATPFPKDEMVAKFGKDFFTSSFAWMMAMAMHQGASEIALFGIDMASRDEYILQRPGFFFFRYLAQQQGIKVWAPNESDIMQSPGLYGFSEVTPFGRKVLARKKELKDRLGPMIAQRDQLSQNIAYLQGAVEDIDYIESIWLGQGG